MKFLLFCAAAAAATLPTLPTLVTASTPAAPNLIWIVTDDQDQMLGGSFPQLNNNNGPMPKTQLKMQTQGTMAENFYIHTPICNPSRNELLSGRYFHNIKATGFVDNQMHVNETYVNANTFVKDLHDSGHYHTGMFGKYMNIMPPLIPPGFDTWMANNGGDYIKPQFQLYNVDGLLPGLVPVPNNELNCWNGGHAKKSKDPKYGCFQGTNAPSNYSTSIIGNASIAWITKVVTEAPLQPFFAYIAPKAAHEPFNPAPWYEGHWDEAWPRHEPRDNPAWNATLESRQDHHGNIATNPMLSAESAQVITGVFKNRWRTLMSVDDLISDVIDLTVELNIADNTYIFYSSDHGFQLGELNMLMDKRHVYEWDTKIHLLAIGPGIVPGSTWSQPATQVDMAATFLDFAGVPVSPERFDGKSIKPMLVPTTTSMDYIANWRDNVFIEYYYVAPNLKCVENCTALTPEEEYPLTQQWCGDLTPGANTKCWGGKQCTTDCYPTEDLNNNFIGIRYMKGSAQGDVLYAEFQHGNQIVEDIDFSHVNFRELYNNTVDPWQMNNLIPNGSGEGEDSFARTKMGRELHSALHQWYRCKGSTCL